MNQLPAAPQAPVRVLPTVPPPNPQPRPVRRDYQAIIEQNSNTLARELQHDPIWLEHIVPSVEAYVAEQFGQDYIPADRKSVV